MVYYDFSTLLNEGFYMAYPMLSQAVDTEGYYRFYNALINMYAEYLREELPTFKNMHERNKALFDFELTTRFINPYSTKENLLLRALEVLSELSEIDDSKPLWQGDPSVRLAKLNTLVYQHAFFKDLPLDLQANVSRLIQEQFPSVLKNPAGERSDELDPLLQRIFQRNFSM